MQRKAAANADAGMLSRRYSVGIRSRKYRATPAAVRLSTPPSNLSSISMITIETIEPSRIVKNRRR